MHRVMASYHHYDGFMFNAIPVGVPHVRTKVEFLGRGCVHCWKQSRPSSRMGTMTKSKVLYRRLRRGALPEDDVAPVSDRGVKEEAREGVRKTLQRSKSGGTPPAIDTDDLACYGTGNEVECVITGEEGSVAREMKRGDTRVGGSDEKSVVSRALDLALLVSPFFFWGTSMVAMKELEPHTTPMFVAAWRLVPAGMVLLLWSSLAGNRGPSTPIGWLAVGLFGLIDGACFQGFLAEGLQRTSAGLGSVIIDSQPLSVALIASVLFGETLGTVGIIGLLLGVGGLLLLETPPELISGIVSLDSSAFVQNGSFNLWDSGEWWMLLAAQSMAVGTVMVRWVSKYSDPIAATGWHMILGGIPLVALAIHEGSGINTLNSLDGIDYLLLLYVSLFGSAASYGVFFYQATVRGNLTALSSLTFLTPMFAAASGYFVLGEVLTPLQLAGALVTIVGVTCINKGDAS